MNHLFDENIITPLINKKVEDLALGLMKNEEKNHCLAGISIYDWRIISYKNRDGEDDIFVIVPSSAFKRFILDREYLKVLDLFSEHFGCKNDWEIVSAIKKYDKNKLVREYSDEEYLEYLSGETMAYIFKIEKDNSISDKVLRLDLCRGINKGNEFQGGIFHILKHFSLGEYETISSFGKEFPLEAWGEIYHNIISNFFSSDFKPERENCYEAKSRARDGHVLRGIYFKNPEVPVYFLNSLRVDKNE